MFSILLPVHKVHKFLFESIDSCLKLRNGNFELIIILNGPDRYLLDGLINKRFVDGRMRFVFSSEPDLSVALNAGLNAARFDWIVRMDSDDICMVDRLTILQNSIDFEKTNILYFANFIEIDCDGNVISKSNIHAPYLFHKNKIVHPTVCFHRSLVLSVGGYRDRKFAEDYDLWIRLSLVGARFTLVKKPAINYRTDGVSGARKNPTAYLSMMNTQIEFFNRQPLLIFSLVLTTFKYFRAKLTLNVR